MSQYKVLGQVNPTTTGVLTGLYTVPTNTQAFCSTLSICNQGSVTSAVRVAVQPNGSGISAASYILYDQIIYPNDSLFLTIGLALSQSDVINVQATTSSISFNLFGSQI
jgi:hypothetical protein